MHHLTDRISHTMACVTPVVEHWLEREIAQWVLPMKDRSDDPSHHERTLLPRSYISLLITLVNTEFWQISADLRCHLPDRCDIAKLRPFRNTVENVARPIRNRHHIATLARTLRIRPLVYVKPNT